MPRFRPPPSQAAALTFALLAAALPSTRLAAQIATEQVSFARDVLPILSDRCFSCHGPDARAR
ncbi:MAG: hypothetical protein KDE27_29960, partial [Planctomycetes bacterium]|nr:hypothetical protein [Planctomycetota bacterium]